MKIQRRRKGSKETRKGAGQMESTQTQGRDGYFRHEGGKMQLKLLQIFLLINFMCFNGEYYLVNVKISEAVCEDLKIKASKPGKSIALNHI